MAEWVRGRVKWFDGKKGFGFVAVEPGDVEAFLHRSALERSLVPEESVRNEVALLVEVDGHGEVTRCKMVEDDATRKEERLRFAEMRVRESVDPGLRSRDVKEFQEALEELVRFAEKHARNRKVVREIVFRRVALVVRDCGAAAEFVQIQGMLEALQVFYRRLVQSQIDFSTRQRKAVQEALEQMNIAFVWRDSSEKADEGITQAGNQSLRKIYLQKINQVLQKRTGRIVLVLDQVTNLANRAAIYRTAESLGIQHIWVVFPKKHKPVPHSSSSNRTHSQGVFTKASKRAEQWLSIRGFFSPEDCIAELLSQQREIWTAELHHSNPTCLENCSEIQIPQKMALVMGSESSGVCPQFSKAATRAVYYPMSGFCESLNVNTSTALILQRLLNICPEAIGDLSSETKQELREKWLTLLIKESAESNSVSD